MRGRSPRRRLRIRDQGARGSLERLVRPAGSPPRHSPNSRPPRRTRRSVRPAPAAESPIEPWFAPARDPSACMRPGGSGAQGRRPMRKKQTASQTRKHPAASSRKQSGLIAQGKNAPQSAAPKCALDNRSHRTSRASAAAQRRASGRSLRIHGVPPGHKPTLPLFKRRRQLQAQVRRLLRARRRQLGRERVSYGIASPRPRAPRYPRCHPTRPPPGRLA